MSIPTAEFEEIDVAAAGLAAEVGCAGALTPDAQHAFAVLHMHHLADLVAQPHRGAFLFTCWRQWTCDMEPERRGALGRHAEAQGPTLLRTAAHSPVGRRLGTGWARYLRAVGAAAAAQAPELGIPPNLLLFDQARRTHALLGIALPAAALGARVVRGALQPASAGCAGTHPAIVFLPAQAQAPTSSILTA